ncbi:pectinesterase 3-like [Primulina huaijiensis]|uniref:pectinesterase 3-like n=1 Tax=Primulina huaijiensis TaxID=1492673 RepID=UPI003CC77355
MGSRNDSFKTASFDGLEEQERKKTPDTVEVFESIKNDEFEEEEYHRQTRKRLIIITVASVVLIVLIIGAIIGVIHGKDSPPNSNQVKDPISKACISTKFQDSCYSSIHSLVTSSKDSTTDHDSPSQIFSLSLKVTLNELLRLHSSILQRSVSFGKNGPNGPSSIMEVLNLCENLIQDAIDRVNMSISSSSEFDKFSRYEVSDVRNWLSSAITYEQTCLDSLVEFPSISTSILEEMKANIQKATEFTSNSLEIISNTFTTFQSFKIHVLK